jgi:hypothetical protein
MGLGEVFFDFKTRHARHHEVEEDTGDGVAGVGLEESVAGVEGEGKKSVQAKQTGKGDACAGIVVDNGDERSVGGRCFVWVHEGRVVKGVEAGLSNKCPNSQEQREGLRSLTRSSPGCNMRKCRSVGTSECRGQGKGWEGLPRMAGAGFSAAAHSKFNLSRWSRI